MDHFRKKFKVKHPLELVYELGETHFNFSDEQIIFIEAMVKLLFRDNGVEYVVYIGEDNHRSQTGALASLPGCMT